MFPLTRVKRTICVEFPQSGNVVWVLCEGKQGSHALAEEGGVIKRLHGHDSHSNMLVQGCPQFYVEEVPFHNNRLKTKHVYSWGVNVPAKSQRVRFPFQKRKERNPQSTFDFSKILMSDCYHSNLMPPKETQTQAKPHFFLSSCQRARFASTQWGKERTILNSDGGSHV